MWEINSPNGMGFKINEPLMRALCELERERGCAVFDAGTLCSLYGRGRNGKRVTPGMERDLLSRNHHVWPLFRAWVQNDVIVVWRAEGAAEAVIHAKAHVSVFNSLPSKDRRTCSGSDSAVVSEAKRFVWSQILALWNQAKSWGWSEAIPPTLDQ